MTHYDFLSLSPVDFEELVRDLLQPELSVRLESFASGRDRGIDLRYARAGEPSLIVQCKHYHRSGFSSLKRAIERDELPKIRNLAPERYVLCTSAELTPERKQELIDILAPFCADPGDILGLEDLNNLLGRHPEIERKHHKLWLTSESVLQRVLNNPTFLQTEIERAHIRRRLALYVQTSAFERAARILKDHNYCIISGIPGIGKTTLAEILIVRLLHQGFDLVVATTSLSEALRLFRADPQQVIYYDDFLGRSSFGENLEKNEDRTLLRLLREVRESSSKKLILTTREYILAQARDSYELLNNPAIALGKCIVQLDDYSRYERARILYNHLYFHEVPREYIDALLADRRYLRVIDHPHFSPRIVEWMTDTISLAHVRPDNYAHEFLANLQNPARLWAHAFDNDLSADARHIILVLGCMPHPCPLDAVRTACGFSDGDTPGEGSRRFLRAVKEVDGTFVRTFRSRNDQGAHLVDFHNPSISDFVLRRLGKDPNLCRTLLEQAAYFEQIDRLLRLTRDGSLDRTPTGVISEAPLIASSVKRLLRADSAGVIRVKSGNRHWWSSNRVSIGRRLESASKWAESLDSNDLHQEVVDLVGTIVEVGELETLSVEDLSGILKAIHRSSQTVELDVTAIYSKVCDAAIAALERMGSLDEWGEWTAAVDAVGDVLSAAKHRELKRLAKEFCEAEPEAIRSSASSQDEAAAWLEDLSAVANSWGIDMEDEIEALHASLEESFPPEPEADYEFDSWERGRAGGDAEAIERLFDSLKG